MINCLGLCRDRCDMNTIAHKLHIRFWPLRTHRKTLKLWVFGGDRYAKSALLRVRVSFFYIFTCTLLCVL